MSLKTVTRPEDVLEEAARWRAEGARIALVPTMGALHDGHLSLVHAAKQHAARVVVSIFVNPTQFAPHEDFSRYPRNLDADRARLTADGAIDLVYAPSPETMYPAGFASSVQVEGPSKGLETDFRPHFFSGVATVVAKLLLQTRPDVAVFGEKDYQQLLVIRRLTLDLDLGVRIEAAPILRETDGLALSSRNAYLDARQRAVAPHLHQTLLQCAERAKAGISLPQTEAEGAAALLNAGFDRVDYVAIRNAETLQPLHGLEAPARILAAAHLGGTRLIDNIAL